MDKPKLLDLFCGGVDAHNALWYNKICLSSVATVVQRLRLNVAQKRFAQLDVSRGYDWVYLKREIAYTVARLFRLAKVTIIGDIALSLVLRKRLLKRRWLGMRLTPMLWESTIRIVWLKIRAFGVISTIMKGWKPYIYWGVNVQYAE